MNGIGHKLNDADQKTSMQIKEFLKQARTALASGDVDGANTLAAKAKAEQEAKEHAEADALAEVLAERKREYDNNMSENSRRYEMEKARRESQIDHDRIVTFQQQAKRDEENEERKKLRLQQEQERQATARAQGQMDAWKRALAIPIRRH